MSFPRRHAASALVLGLVALSTAVRFAVSLGVDAPWIASDEMFYGLLGRSLWETGRLRVLDADAPYYGLYPALAGLPLAAFGPAAGLVVLQALQALLVSSTAAIAYAWARTVVRLPWALTAAALTAALPALAYSGLVMTEAVFLPVVTLTLWSLARALARPTRTRQLLAGALLLLACATRVQGVVLLPALVTSVLLMAAFSRDAAVVRRFVPTFAAIALAGAGWIAAHLVVGGSWTASFGAYGVAVGNDYDVAEALRWVGRHAGDVFLLVLGVPLVGALVLAAGAALGRERDVDARALLAVTFGYLPWLVVQVGVFASRFVEQLAERDLITLAPPLFACFALWLGRGLPRPQPLTSAVAVLVAVPAVLLPVKELVTPAATPDAFMTVPLLRLLERTSASTLETAWVIGAAAAIALAVITPRRFRALLAVLVVAGLVASSVLASREIAHRATADRSAAFGARSTRWVDETSTEPVAYFYDGSPLWNTPWQYAFWNERITRVLTPAGELPGDVPGRTVVYPRDDGVLVDRAGRTLSEPLLLAPANVAVAGDRLEETGVLANQPSLSLWRLSGPPTLSSWTTGLLPNGDIVQPVHVVVFGCGPGALALTLLGKSGAPVTIAVPGGRTRTVTVAPEQVWRGELPAPREADGSGRCTFRLLSPGLVGSTRIEFVRR